MYRICYKQEDVKSNAKNEFDVDFECIFNTVVKDYQQESISDQDTAPSDSDIEETKCMERGGC